MLSDVRRRELISKSTLIFINLPIGNNSYSDSPIVGNKTLAQVIVNRIDSITKNKEEFKYMVDVVTQFLKETKGKEIEKIKFNNPSDTLQKLGIVDRFGNLIRKEIKGGKKLDFDAFTSDKLK